MRTLVAVLLVATCAMAADTPDQLIKAGHWKRARPLIEAALQKNANDAVALTRISTLKRMAGDVDAAQQFAEKAVAADPKNPDAHLALAYVLADKAQKASMFSALGTAHAIRRELDTVLALAPGNVDAHYFLMEFLFDAPGVAGGDKTKARQEADAIGGLDRARGFVAQAYIAEREKRRDVLADLYRKAHDAAPTRYEAVTPWCNYTVSEKRWADAEQCGRELLSLDSGRPGGYSVLAWVYASQQRWSDLDKILADGEKGVPDNLSPYFNAGRVLAESGADNARGERYLRKYLSQEPEPNGPKPAFAHWRLGQILDKAGRRPEAIAELETTLRLQPKFEPAEKDLKRMR